MSRFATIVAEEWLTGIILGRWMLSNMLDPWGVLVAVGGIAHIAVLILKVFANIGFRTAPVFFLLVLL